MFQYLGLIYLVWVTAVSLFTFAVYGWDKRQARLDRLRVPEARLHLLAGLGGWPGAWAGQQFFRHKTQKASFRWITGLAMMLHLTMIALVVWLQFV